MTKVLRADDKRRNYHKAAVDDEKSEVGHAKKRLSGVFHDRRGANGHGKRAK